jgi:putative peptide zinc metalloprotease protein
LRQVERIEAMEEDILSSSWYRVAGLKPRLRSHAQIHRHSYRGETWYVLQDHATGRFHRFTPEAYLVIGLMDGRRTLEGIWDAACRQLGDDVLTQDEVIRLLAQLYQADVLQTDMTPDIGELLERRDRVERTRLLSYVRSPVALRLPVLDPDRFLDRTMRFVSPVFGSAGLILWALALAAGIAVVVLHWDALTSDVVDRVLSMQNLLLVGLIYPVVKALHEFGHAYAVKRWGGEVHEMGIMLLVFVPIPYVEASAATAFRRKRQRVVVGAAGILIETFIAGLAAVVWAVVEPGTVRAVAYNTMLIAGISTLAFNANPLLRFDGYYILADWLEIPNLSSRGSQYLGYLLQRYVLGIKGVRNPATGRGEAGWLGGYALASLVYRMFIIVAIVLLAASRFLSLGVVIAGWVVFNVLWPPLSKARRFLFDNPQTQERRFRATLIVSGLVAAIVVFVAAVPLPLSTTAEGIVWVSEHGRVRAGGDGFVAEVVAHPGAPVSAGEPLIRCENPGLVMQTAVIAARLRELELRYRAALSSDRNEAVILADQVARVRAEHDRAVELQDELVIRATADGRFVLIQPEDLLNRYVARGSELGYVTDLSHVTVRVVVPQANASLVRGDLRRTDVRLAGSAATEWAARVVRETPTASTDLPSQTLSLQGGGSIALDPRGAQGLTAMERLFQFDIEVDGAAASGVEERVFVRFQHTPEPVGFRWYRGIRRLLMRRFDV